MDGNSCKIGCAQLKKFIILLFCLLVGCVSNPFKMTEFEYKPPDAHRTLATLVNVKTSPKIEHFALLIGANTEQRHRNNLSLAYQVLIEQGYDRRLIFILDSEGGNPVTYPLTDVTTYDSFDTILGWLQKNMGVEDTLLVYITGHGTKSGLVFNKKQTIQKSIFWSMLEKTIYPSKGIIFTDICYWGAHEHMWDIEKSTWVILSVTDSEHTSQGSSFPRLFWRSFRELNEKSLSSHWGWAVSRDPGVKSQGNRPQIRHWSVNPKNINIRGEDLTH